MLPSLSAVDASSGTVRSSWPWPVRVLRIALVGMTVAYAVSTTPLHPLFPRWLVDGLDNGIHLLAACVVAWRAMRVARQRFAWSMMALGLGFFAAATLYAWFADRAGIVLPFPSLADLGWLLFFPFAYVGIVALIHGQAEHSRTQMVLDGLIAGLGVAAVFASVVVGLLIAPSPYQGYADIAALGFPVGDALLVGTLCGILTVGGRSARRSLGLLAIAMVTFAVADTAYVTLVSHDAYQDGGIVSLGYLTTLMLIGLRAWGQDPDQAAVPVHHTGSSTVLPTVFALSSLGLILAATRLPVPPVGVILAGVSLLAVVGRGVVSFRQVNTMARYDRLTGLPNRALITDRLDELLARNRERGTRGAALFIDLDGFKSINDALGHAAGDQLLRTVADRLAATVRDPDTVGRLGGDEFVVLVDGGSLQVTPELVAARLLEVMRTPFILENAPRPVVVTTSIGIAAGDRDTAADMLRDADVALYRAKAAGKNCLALFSPEMQAEVQRECDLERDLDLALERNQFRLVYQPIYNLADLSLVSVEALLRWQHPTLGVVQPDAFIPKLEADGRIVDVGRWVLLESCRQMREWHARGTDLSVSVNVSGRQLDRHSIVDHVAEALAGSGLDPSRLILEITETALMKEPEMTARRLRLLKALGVLIAIDDFGTGYSSLAYLQQFRVDCLKIDRMFTDGIARSPESDAMVHALVGFGKDLGLTIVAEGVETPGQIDRLRGEEVEQVQGFLLSRPLTPEEVEGSMLGLERLAVATR